jgi:AmiR/NasT family two-component response regulator
MSEFATPLRDPAAAAPAPELVESLVPEAGGEHPELGGDSLRESARRAQARAVELRTLTEAVLADARRTIELSTSRQLGVGRVDALIREVAGLRRAMESRAVIEQAKGIVIAATGCDADGAFRLLAQQSQHENRKLADVARDLVVSKSRPSTGGSGASG